MRILILSMLLTGIATLAACGGGSSSSNPPVNGGDPQTALIEQGQLVYSTSRPMANSFACATCHALSEPANDGLRRAGHPIGDALRRQSYKGGQLNNFIDAANTCLDDWMGLSTPWTEDTPDYKALVAFLEDQDTDSGATTDVTFTILDPSVPDEVATGDSERGKTTFNETCASCHGEDAEGGLDVGFALTGVQRSTESIVQRVRTSGSPDSIYTGLTGGRMPFWSLERLSNRELGDIVAFLDSVSDSSTSGSSSSGGTPGGMTPGSNCSTDHPSVGKTAVLSTLQHNVSGLATIVDDCTIEFTGFNYDGEGITIFVYGGKDGNYSDFGGGPGFPIGPDLKRSGMPYNNESFRVQLPNNRTLDDLNGVSIWCSAVGISFGDGLFN